MKIGSLFDGSGGFPLAGVICGMEPVWASEIEPYPLKVTGSERAGEILFEREGVRGNIAASHEAWKKLTAHAAGGSDGSGADGKEIDFHLQQDPISGRIRPCIGGQHQETIGVFMGGQGEKAGSIAYSEECCPTLRASESGTNQAPDVVYAMEGNTIDRASNKNGKGWCEGVSPTLNTQDRHGVATALNAWDIQSNRIYGINGCFGTLDAHMGGGGGDYKGIVYPKIAGTLCANSHPGSYTGQDAFNDMLPVIKTDKPPRKYIVRRLTPLECCRLQGFPD